MKSFLESKMFYGILAVVIAVFLSLYVASVENPIVERTFQSINIAVSGLPVDHILDGEPGHAEIRVSGYHSVVNLTPGRDVRAYVELQDAQPGTSRYPVKYSLPAG